MKYKALFLLSVICFLLLNISEMQAQEPFRPTPKDMPPPPLHDSLRHSAVSMREKRLVRINKLLGEVGKEFRADSALREFDSKPPFGTYKDNFFVVGTTLSGKVDKYHSDAKFQVSIRHRLTKSILPFKTYLFLTYTQKAIWDVFEESFPFRDLNYNPAIGVGKALVTKDGRLIGGCSVFFEHESNGRGGEASRSWNKITFTGSIQFNRRWQAAAQVWIPFVDGENNRDLTRYVGWANCGIEYRIPNTKCIASVVYNKRSVSNLGGNLTIRASYRLSVMANQSLFMEFYSGYAENLLNYSDYRLRFRVGFVIKSDMGVMF